jgi:hypothetical protein
MYRLWKAGDKKGDFWTSVLIEPAGSGAAVLLIKTIH